MDHRISEVICVLEGKFPEIPNLESLAANVNLSVSYLQHLFKLETGISIRKYVKAKRMNLAVELLQNTNLRIKEITFRIGARDDSHFIRDFRDEFGVYPSKYRKMFREKMIAPIDAGSADSANLFLRDPTKSRNCQ